MHVELQTQIYSWSQPCSNKTALLSVTLRQYARIMNNLRNLTTFMSTRGVNVIYPYDISRNIGVAVAGTAVGRDLSEFVEQK